MKKIGTWAVAVVVFGAIAACDPTVRDYNSSNSSSSQGGAGGGTGGMSAGGAGGEAGMGGEAGSGGGVIEAGPPDLACRGGNPACGNSCTDGVKNYGETAIDCGGPCKPCPTCGIPTFQDSGLALAPNFDPGAVIARDFNGDTLTDVVIVGNGPAQIYLNAGAGQGLQLTQTLPPNSQAEQAVAQDIDGDCDLDLLTVGYETILWMNDGAGNMTMLQPIGMPSQFTAGEPGFMDIDNDGAPDLVTTRYNLFEVWQNRLTSLGIFVKSGEQPLNGNRANAYGCRDGRPILVSRETLEMRLWEANASGFVQYYGLPEMGGYNYGVAFADMNSDGAVDLVLGNDNLPSAVRMNDLGIGFGPEMPFGFARYARRVVVADFNTDGHSDVAIANWGMDPAGTCGPGANQCPQQSEVWFNDGTGQLYGGQNIGRLATTMGIAAADMDNDGDLDLIVAERDAAQPLERSTRILLNTCK